MKAVLNALAKPDALAATVHIGIEARSWLKLPTLIHQCTSVSRNQGQ